MKLGDIVAERYELEELLGTGGMSSVYCAKDLLLERRVALKILHDSYGADPETIERFRREARAVAQLSHPNIVTVIDRGEDEHRQFIVFEYIEGENLKELLERTGRLPVRRALELAIDVGRALAFAHAAGLVHRDVKPQNVLVNGDGEPKVMDFGIARSLDVEGVTATGTVLGTSNYIAPEQASGLPVDTYTDVYSLGVVLYELLTDEVPFTGDSFVAIAMKHVHEPAPSVLELRPEVPLRVASAIERALEKAPERRFRTMDEFVGELEASLGELGASATEDSTAIIPPQVVRESAPRRARARRRRVWPLLAVLAAVALVAVAIALALTRGDPGVVSGPDGGGSEAAPVKLTGVAAYDPPPGDGREHPDEVGEATDGDLGTSWTTEKYESFAETKDGVGLVLAAGRVVELESVTVRTDTPGFTAQIQVGSSTEGPFEPVSTDQPVGATTTFELEPRQGRYVVVWITDIPPGSAAHVNEVTARS